MNLRILSGISYIKRGFQISIQRTNLTRSLTVVAEESPVVLIFQNPTVLSKLLLRGGKFQYDVPTQIFADFIFLSLNVYYKNWIKKSIHF